MTQGRGTFNNHRYRYTRGRRYNSKINHGAGNLCSRVGDAAIGLEIDISP